MRAYSSYLAAQQCTHPTGQPALAVIALAYSAPQLPCVLAAACASHPHTPSQHSPPILMAHQRLGRHGVRVAHQVGVHASPVAPRLCNFPAGAHGSKGQCAPPATRGGLHGRACACKSTELHACGAGIQSPGAQRGGAGEDVLMQQHPCVRCGMCSHLWGCHVSVSDAIPGKALNPMSQGVQQ